MRWRDIGETSCSVARALSVVGDPWTLLILRESFLGARRFAEFRERLDVARPLLAERLRRLVRHGVLERRHEAGAAGRPTYRLTAKGRDLYPVLLALLAWGDRWMAHPEGAPLELEHRCGHRGHLAWTCPGCGEAIRPEDVTPRLRGRPRAPSPVAAGGARAVSRAGRTP